MTTVDVVFRYAKHPTEPEMFALGKTREVYGIRNLTLNQAGEDHPSRIRRHPVDPATVAHLMRGAGLTIAEEVSLIPPQPPPKP